jgi:periplasmic protein TonB
MSAALPYLPNGFDAASPARSRLKRFGPLLPIIVLHGVLFYALQSGTGHRVAQPLPPAFFATLIPSEPAQAQKAPDLPLKTVPVTKPALPVLPAIDPVAVVPAIAVAAPLAAAPNAPSLPAPATTGATAPAAPSVPKTVSGVEYIQPPQPEYPPLSRRMGEQGKVILRVLVNDKGRAERIELQRSSGVARLDEAARNAVARAVFKPYLEDGKAIAVYVIVPIGFQLD